MPRASWRAETRNVGLLWFCLFVRLLFYVSVTPLWEGFDEYSHFGVLQFVAAHGVMPAGTEQVSREIDASLRLAPVPYAQRSYAAESLPQDLFWQLPPAERTARLQALQAIPASWGQEPSANGQTLWEAQQAPLFYLLLAPVMWLLRGTDLLVRVWTVRLLCVTIASCVLPIAYLVARRMTGHARWALLSTAVLVAMPEFVMMQARVSNECVATVAGAGLVWTLVAWRSRPWLVGLCTAVALLAKAYFLGALIVLLAFRINWRAWVPIGGLAGWWYARNWWTTGSWSGQIDDSGSGHLSLLARLSKLPDVAWGRAADGILNSHIWVGNWSFLGLRSWMYRVIAMLFLCALVGLIMRWRDRRLWAPAALYASLAAALAYHVLVTYLNQGISASTGWYLYGFVAAEVVLLVAGLQRGAAVLVVCLTSVELFGTHVYLLPYYTGLIVHTANGGVPGMTAARWIDKWTTIWQRLCAAKPAFWSAGLLEALWVCYLLATLTNVAVALRQATLRERSESPLPVAPDPASYSRKALAVLPR